LIVLSLLAVLREGRVLCAKPARFMFFGEAVPPSARANRLAITCFNRPARRQMTLGRGPRKRSAAVSCPSAITRNSHLQSGDLCLLSIGIPTQYHRFLARVFLLRTSRSRSIGGCHRCFGSSSRFGQSQLIVGQQRDGSMERASEQRSSDSLLRLPNPRSLFDDSLSLFLAVLLRISMWQHFLIWSLDLWFL
jgi:hypothetical protein